MSYETTIYEKHKFYIVYDITEQMVRVFNKEPYLNEMGKEYRNPTREEVLLAIKDGDSFSAAYSKILTEYINGEEW